MSKKQQDGDPLEPLLAKLFEAPLTLVDQEQLATLLSADAELRKEYAEYVHAHALLVHWSAAQASITSADLATRGNDVSDAFGSQGLVLATRSPESASKVFSERRLWAALASVALVAALAMWWAGDRPQTAGPSGDSEGWGSGRALFGREAGARPGDPQYVAIVTQQWSPVWETPGGAAVNWSRIEVGREFQLKSGRLSCLFHVGAEVILQGPVRARVLGPNSIQVDYGNLDVRVAESGKGFTVVSASGKVVDLGTEFGICVRSDGEMDVVVFDGEVELQRTSAHAWRTPSPMATSEPLRIAMGQAIRVSPGGKSSRIAQVDYDQFPRSTDFFAARKAVQPVIRSIEDNLRTADLGSFYQICAGGLVEDARAYVDRVYEWNGVDERGIPEELLGADYVRMFNDDKRRSDYEITIRLARPAYLYVFWDERYAPPDWLKQRFSRTEHAIAMDTNASELEMGVGPGVLVDDLFSVWRLRVGDPAEPIKLGNVTDKFGDGPPPKKMHVSMYGVAAVALGN